MASTGTNEIPMRYRFSHRIIISWNLLLKEVVFNLSIESLSERLDIQKLNIKRPTQAVGLLL